MSLKNKLIRIKIHLKIQKQKFKDYKNQKIKKFLINYLNHNQKKIMNLNNKKI